MKTKFLKYWNWLLSDKKRWITAVFLLVVVVGLFYLKSKSTKNQVSYQTSTVQKGTVVSVISASGKVVATGTLPISTNASGVVKKVYVKDGDKVVVGQKIAEITLDQDGLKNQATAYSQLISAQNGVSSAQNNLRSSVASADKVLDDLKGHENDETFAQKETRTKAEVSRDNAYLNLSNAQASLTTAAITYRLSSSVITSSYSGVIEGVNIVEGVVLTSSSSSSNSSSTTTAASSQKIATVKSSVVPVVNVSLGETDVPKVKIGQKTTVTFDSIPEKTFTGVVATVDRTGTVSSNVTSYSLNIKLDRGSDLILSNMAATSSIIVDTATNVLYVPSTSIVTQNGEVLVKTLVNGSEVDVPVETGISSDTETVIKSGLNEGQTVITGNSATTSSSSTSTQRSVFSGGGFGGTVRFAR